MPLYSIDAPDGNTYSIEGPEGATREQVIRAIQFRLSQPPEPKAPEPVAPVAPPPPSGGFFPAFARGAIQTQSLIADILPGMIGKAVGAEDYAQQQFKEAAEKERLIQEKYAAAVPSYKDIKGVGDVVTYVTESVGELLPSIIPSIFTGGAAGIVGRGAIIAAKEAAETAARKAVAQNLGMEAVEAAAKEAGLKAAANMAIRYEAVGAVTGSALQNIPDVYKNVKDETGEDSLGAALLFGGFNSLLDAALPIATLAKFKRAGIPGEEVMGEWYKRFGKGAAKGFATEGATEAAQEMSSAAAEKFVDENKEFFTEKNLERFLNAGLKGGLGGGVVSGSTDVMLGKKAPTQDELVKQLRPGETLEQGIQRIYGDLSANRQYLDELRAMEVEENKTVLTPDVLKDIGFTKTDPVYNLIVDKDLNNPQDAADITGLLKEAVEDKKSTQEEKALYANSLVTFQEYLSTRGFPSVETVQEPSGAGVPVAGEPSMRAAPAGAGVVEPGAVGVPPTNAPGIAVGEGAAPAPLEVKAPEVPQVSPQAPEVPAAPEAPKAPEVKAPEVPTTADLIKIQEQKVEGLRTDFQDLLKQQINRYGLKNVALNVVSDMKDANGQYSNGLIKLAIDADDPVRDLRHETIHALKELGFFTDAQWNTLVKMAKDKWMDEHLHGKDVSGNFLEEGKQSRYEAYKDLYSQRGMSEAQVNEALIEEAIADAFGGFAKTKPPPGLMNAILNRLRNFFQAIKNTVSSSPETAEQIFGKITEGKLAPTEAVKTTETEKPSLRAPQFKEDIPNEDWLRGKVEDAKEGGRNQFGVPKRMGSVTGYFSEPVSIPVDLLSKIPGESAEQTNVRPASLDYIRKNWDEVSKRPVYIEVDPFGKAWVNEGNHRIMVAKELGVKSLPANVRYFSGGQRLAKELAPANLQKLHAPEEKPSIRAPKKDLEKSLSDKRVSPRLPTAVKATEDPMAAVRLQPDLDTFKRDSQAFAHNIDLMSKYPNYTGLQGDANDRSEQMLGQMVGNLKWLFNHWKPELRERSRLWYVGGNRISHRWAKQFDIAPEKVAGVIAALSPQKDWFQNVSLAERILDAVVKNSDTAWDQNMTNVLMSRDWGKKLSGELKYTPAESIKKFEGKTLKDLYRPGDQASLLDMAVWIRAFDEANNPQVARVITPEGVFTNEVDVGKNGKPIALRAQSFGAMTRALKVLQASNVNDISSVIGSNHKVRSFYNNIIAPFDDQDVTIDTHAVAAALLRPLGSSDTEVNHNFGANTIGQVGPANSTLSGLNGMYPMYAEAYRRAAKEMGVLPREMQSITWEAVRGLFRPEQKVGSKAKADAIWDQVAKGEIDADTAREQISELVQGIQDPAWVRSPVGSNEAKEDSSYPRELPSAGQPGRPEGRGGESRTAPGTEKRSIRAPRLAEFEEFFKGSKAQENGNPVVYYHGALRDKKAFRPKVAGAIFFSPDPGFATGYVNQKLRELASEPGMYLSAPQIRSAVRKLRQYVYDTYGRQSKSSKDLLSDITEIEDQGKKTGIYKFRGELRDVWQGDENNFWIIEQEMMTGRNITPVFINVQNPFDYEDKKQLNRVLNKLTTSDKAGDRMEKEGLFKSGQTFEEQEKIVKDYYRDPLSRGDWKIIEAPEVQEIIRDLKHDGFYAAEEHTDGAIKNLAVYDKSQVKSALGNVGAYGQRPVTKEEAAPLGMTEEEAKKAQEEGDIRMSLRKPGDPVTRVNVLSAMNLAQEKQPYMNCQLCVQMATGVSKILDLPRVTKAQVGDIYTFNERNNMASHYAVELGNGNVAEVEEWGEPVREVPLADVIAEYDKPSTIRRPPDTAYSNTFVKPSLRSQVDPAITTRMLQTTTAREQVGFIKRITTALHDPDSRSKFRAQALNRYNRLSDYDKLKLERSGGMDLYADATAESAALFSDLGAGILASAFGVHDKVGGAPVYKRHYVVQKRIPHPNGLDSFTQVGTQYDDLATAEALAKKVGGEVREHGYVGVSNFNDSVKGPLQIFAPLAKYNDPDIYRYYQYWAGVKRGSKYLAVPQPGGGFKVEEKLFNDPKDIARAKQLEAQFPEFKTVQQEWVKYNDQLVNFMRDTGVISKEAAAEFTKHGDYLPFYRQAEEDENAVGPTVFQSIGRVQPPKKLKHGEDPLGDFLENVVRNSQAAIQSGIKNIAARRAADVGMDVGTVAKLPGTSTDPNAFYVMENGKKVYYNSADMLFIEAVKSLGLPNVPFIGLLAGPANTLRNLVTKDPGFMLANMMRDSLSAWATTGVDMPPIVATLKNFTDALANKSPEIKAMYGSGILGGYDYSKNVMDAAKTFEKQLRKEAGAATTKEKALKPVTYIWEALEKGTSASDAATRIEIFKKTLDKTGNEAEALFRSLEVMNFNRKGANPIIRVATAAIPFLNARIQGLDVLYRAAFAENATKDAKAIQKAFFVRGMTMMALSSMYWLLTHDDDDYKKQEQETRDNNWLLPSLGVRIPIPFEVGVLFKVIPERILEYTFGQDTAKDFTKSMFRQLSSTLAFNPIPQAALPFIEYTANYSFFTGRPIVGQGMEGVTPAYQAGPGTSRIAQKLGEATKGLPSYLQLSPLKLDQLINGYTGTMGMYAVDLMDSIYDMHSDSPKPSKRFEQLPVFKRFVVDPEARGQVSSYYDLKNSVDEATRTENLLQRSMRFEEYGEYMRDNIKMFAVKGYILDLEKTMKQYNEMKILIRNSKMDADAKRDALTNINRAENQLTSNIQLLKSKL